MAVLFEIDHITTYKYANPVTFGTHRAMFLPRPSVIGRLLSWSVKTSITCKIHWVSDALSNNVTVMEFSEPRQGTDLYASVFGDCISAPKGRKSCPWSLEPKCRCNILRTSGRTLSFTCAPMLKTPMPALRHGPRVSRPLTTVERSTSCARCWTHSATHSATMPRDGRHPVAGRNLAVEKSGTCRDYAWLMIETLRRLGFASRFVSGYLYNSALDGGNVGMVGSGATHAWVQVFLPGAGWTHYDPTNRINAGFNLIPVAIARHPGQAIPLAGSWFGGGQDYLACRSTLPSASLGDVSDMSAGIGGLDRH